MQAKGHNPKRFGRNYRYDARRFSESRQRQPTFETLEKIAAGLGVSVPELFAPQPTNTITCPKCGTVLEVKERG